MTVSVFLSLVASSIYLLPFPSLLFSLILYETSQLLSLSPQLSVSIQKVCGSAFVPPVILAVILRGLSQVSLSIFRLRLVLVNRIEARLA